MEARRLLLDTRLRVDPGVTSGIFALSYTCVGFYPQCAIGAVASHFAENK